MLAEYLQRFKHFTCKQHQEQRLSLVCTEDDCDSKGLICAECQFLNHQGHIVKPVNLLISEIHQDLNKQGNLVSKIARIDQERLKIYALTSKLTNENDRKTICHYIEIFLQDLHKKIMAYYQQCEEILSKENCTVEDLTTFLKKYQVYTKQESQKGNSNFQMFLNEIQSFASGKTVELEEAIKKRVELNDILTIFVPFENEIKANYSFSQQMKHTSITVSGENNIATQKNNYSTNFIFIEPMLEGKRTLRGKKTIKFHIDKLMSWLSIGVAYASFAKKANYYFNTGAIGHGGYLISNNGYSWHHTDSALNSFYEQWNFVQDDVVSVTIDPKAKKIIFQKEGSNDPYELPYETVSSEELYFCVALSSHDESISIVQ